MTDPTFDTLEALEAWADLSALTYVANSEHPIQVARILAHQKTARVRAAHAHLLKGNDDE